MKFFLACLTLLMMVIIPDVMSGIFISIIAAAIYEHVIKRNR